MHLKIPSGHCDDLCSRLYQRCVFLEAKIREAEDYQQVYQKFDFGLDTHERKSLEASILRQIETERDKLADRREFAVDVNSREWGLATIQECDVGLAYAPRDGSSDLRLRVELVPEGALTITLAQLQKRRRLPIDKDGILHILLYEPTKAPFSRWCGRALSQEDQIETPKQAGPPPHINDLKRNETGDDLPFRKSFKENPTLTTNLLLEITGGDEGHIRELMLRRIDVHRELMYNQQIEEDRAAENDDIELRSDLEDDSEQDERSDAVPYEDEQRSRLAKRGRANGPESSSEEEEDRPRKRRRRV